MTLERENTMSICLMLFVLFSCLSPAVLYLHEECSTETGYGKCKYLSKCAHLLNEIRRVGTPMPGHLRRKLQKLSCGFQSDEPLVCCETSNQSNEGFDEYDQSEHTPSSFRPIDQFDPYSSNTNNDPNSNNKNGGFNSNSVDPLPNVSDHPRLRLLPRECGIIESDRIYGGNKTDLFEMPWMVLLMYDSARGTKLSCGGTLITEWYVLTAAHCVSFLGNRLTLRAVILGEYDTRSNPDCVRQQGELVCAPNSRNVSIDSVVAHPGYTPQTLVDDIAIVRLAEPADFRLDSVKPICLPSTINLQSENLDGRQGEVAGWGATENGLQSSVLLSVSLPIISNSRCQSIYSGTPQIYAKQICAGGVEGKDSCGGDSGGPLLLPGRTGAAGLRYVQRGVVSYGSKRCGIGGFPGVYTRVANYMDWILDNIR